MKHTLEVDQSNRIENSGPAYLAFSDGANFNCCIMVPAQVRQAAIQFLRLQGTTKKQAVLKIFAACIYLLLESYIPQIEVVILDNEYDGRGKDIKSDVLRYIWRVAPTFSSRKIQIHSIGKKSPAHQLAWEAYRGKGKIDKIVKERQLLELLK